MARDTVVVITCDVCSKKVEAVSSGTVALSQDFEVEGGGYKDYDFDDLCLGCTKSLMKTFEKWLAGRKK